MARDATLTRSSARSRELMMHGRSGLEFGNVGLRAPHAKRRGAKRKLARAIVGVLGDQSHAGRILVSHAVRSFKVQERGIRGRVTSGSKADGDTLFAQEVIRAHDVIDACHLMVDVLHAMTSRGKQRDLVMHFIDTQQWRLAYPVTDLGATRASPERLVAGRRRGIQPNV